MTREEAWLRAACSSIRSSNSAASIAIGRADDILAAYDDRFKQSFKCTCGATVYDDGDEKIVCENCQKEWARTDAE